MSGLNSFLKNFGDKEKVEQEDKIQNVRVEKPSTLKLNINNKQNKIQHKSKEIENKNTKKSIQIRNLHQQSDLQIKENLFNERQKLYEDHLLEKQKQQAQYQQSCQNQNKQKQTHKVQEKQLGNSKRNKYEASSEEYIQELFNQSETERKFREEWVELYLKGLRSTKKNHTVKKIINGRFRIINGGKMEILSELKTHNMSLPDILKTQWL